MQDEAFIQALFSSLLVYQTREVPCREPYFIEVFRMIADCIQVRYLNVTAHQKVG